MCIRDSLHTSEDLFVRARGVDDLFEVLFRKTEFSQKTLIAWAGMREGTGISMVGGPSLVDHAGQPGPGSQLLNAGSRWVDGQIHGLSSLRAQGRHTVWRRSLSNLEDTPLRGVLNTGVDHDVGAPRDKAKRMALCTSRC